MSARAQRRQIAAQSEPMKELEKLIRANSQRHQVHSVFADFCEMSAIAISNSIDVARRDEREAQVELAPAQAEVPAAKPDVVTLRQLSLF